MDSRHAEYEWKLVGEDFVSLNAMARQVHETSVQRGWWSDYGAGQPHEDHDPTFGEALMLVVTEVAEAMEAFREGCDPATAKSDYIFKDNWDYDVRIQDGKTEFAPRGTPNHHNGVWKPLTPEAVMLHGGVVKPKGVPSELADIIIRVLDICGAWDIDIAAALRTKMQFNTTRPARHGGKRL